MKTKMITAILLIIVIAISCKKKDNNEPATNNSSTTPQNTTPKDSVTFNTLIRINQYTSSPSSNSFSSYSWVRYYNVTLNASDSIGVFGGSSYWHKFTGGGSLSNTETDSTTANVKFHQQYYWMTNTNSIPNTQYLTTNASPYMNISFLQNVNSISKSAGVTISHPTISCTHIDYYISDSPSLSSYINVDGNFNGNFNYHYVKKTVNGNSTGVVFSSADLTSLSLTSSPNSVTGGYIYARAYTLETTHPSTSVSYYFKNTTILTKQSLPITN